jgi:hypothetical protein
MARAAASAVAGGRAAGRPGGAALAKSGGGSSARGPARFISPVALQANAELVAWTRGVVALAGAAACGVMGVTGSVGFAAYVVQHLLVGLALLVRLRLEPGAYLSPQVSSPHPVLFVLGGVGDNLVMWLLVWSFAFAVTHKYG